MPSVELNKTIPDFEATATGDQMVRLADLRGRNVVIYFYPKDDTPGCTTESQDFRNSMPAFTEHDTEIFGVSRDGLKSHDNFRSKFELPFHLISDQDEKLCALFNVIKLKKLYGKEYMGIDRSTFLIDAKGVLRQEWRGIKVPGHVDEVLAAVKAL